MFCANEYAEAEADAAAAALPMISISIYSSFFESTRISHFRWNYVHDLLVLRCGCWSMSYGNSAASSKRIDLQVRIVLEIAIENCRRPNHRDHTPAIYCHSWYVCVCWCFEKHCFGRCDRQREHSHRPWFLYLNALALERGLFFLQTSRGISTL